MCVCVCVGSLALTCTGGVSSHVVSAHKQYVACVVAVYITASDKKPVVLWCWCEIMTGDNCNYLVYVSES